MSMIPENRVFMKTGMPGGAGYPERRGFAVLRLLFFIAPFILLSCLSAENDQQQQGGRDAESDEIRYSKYFSITRHAGYTMIDVHSRKANDLCDDHSYLLVPKGEPVPEIPGPATLVRTPVGKVTCQSGFQVRLLDMIDCFDAISGVASKRSVGQDRIHSMIDRGEMLEIGPPGGMNREMLLELAPDVAFVHGAGRSATFSEDMKRMNVVPVDFCSFREEHPLAVLEWIKFAAAFFERDSLATALFNQREKAYLDLLGRVRIHGEHRPTVIAGYSSKGSWSTMGSTWWFGALVNDAGAKYVFDPLQMERGYLLSSEVAFEAGMNADFWLNTHAHAYDLDQLLSYDARYAHFPSVHAQQVFNNNALCYSNGKTRFWDEGITEPHVLLADLVSMFHPGQLPGYKPVYYKRLVGQESVSR